MNRYYFGRCLTELVQLNPLPYSWGRSTCQSDGLHILFFIIPRCYKDVYVNSFFLHTAKFCNSLPLECFPLTSDLNDCRSNINRYLRIPWKLMFKSKLPLCSIPVALKDINPNHIKGPKVFLVFRENIAFFFSDISK